MAEIILCPIDGKELTALSDGLFLCPKCKQAFTAAETQHYRRGHSGKGSDRKTEEPVMKKKEVEVEVAESTKKEDVRLCPHDGSLIPDNVLACPSCGTLYSKESELRVKNLA